MSKSQPARSEDFSLVTAIEWPNLESRRIGREFNVQRPVLSKGEGSLAMLRDTGLKTWNLEHLCRNL